MLKNLFLSFIAALSVALPPAQAEERARARDLGFAPGVLNPGPLNAITDVKGVRVGHVTLRKGRDVRTGVTAIIPHGDNLYQNKTPAAVSVGNGFGKLMGATQIEELGEIETPIVLTNTLSVPEAAAGLIDWTLRQEGNERVVSVNAVVGETNDSAVNNIRKRVVRPDHVRDAIRNATAGPVEEGAVGAGTGTRAFGWKGGIGTSSRTLPKALGGHTVGALVQSNFGGVLTADGFALGEALGRFYLKDYVNSDDADGSIIIVLATDAPLSDRNLKRLAHRALAGLARTGAAMTNGSGDYVIAFSTAPSVRRTPAVRARVSQVEDMPNARMSPLFQAAIEASEEAILNSIFMATTTDGFNARTGEPFTLEAIPLDETCTLSARC